MINHVMCNKHFDTPLAAGDQHRTGIDIQHPIFLTGKQASCARDYNG